MRALNYLSPSNLQSNLVRNAEHACVQSGKAERKIVISAELRESVVHIRVTDNGVGIPPEQIDRAFKPFIRLPNPINTPGTGMGLAIVKKAAERMDAAVGAESTPGRGACFWLELPTA